MLHRRSRFHVVMVPGSLPAIFLASEARAMTHDRGKKEGYPPWNYVFPPSFWTGAFAVSFRECFQFSWSSPATKKNMMGKIETLSFIQVSISIKPPCVQNYRNEGSFLFTMPKKALVLWEIHCLIIRQNGSHFITPEIKYHNRHHLGCFTNTFEDHPTW